MHYLRLQLIVLALSSSPGAHAFSMLQSGSPSTKTGPSGTTGTSNLTLGKKSTALDVLNSLNKNSRLASYVANSLNKSSNDRKPIAVVTGKTKARRRWS